MEDAGHEDVLRQEAEVDSPLVEEDSAEVERPYDVLLWVAGEEGEAKDQLDAGADCELHYGTQLAPVSDVEEEDGGGVEQDVHLDRDGQTEEEAAQADAVIHPKIDG